MCGARFLRPNTSAFVASSLIASAGSRRIHTRPPRAFGKKRGNRQLKDEMVIFEVMAPQLDAGWWKQYRQGLEARFRQETIVVRAQEIQLL